MPLALLSLLDQDQKCPAHTRPHDGSEYQPLQALSDLMLLPVSYIQSSGGLQESLVKNKLKLIEWILPLSAGLLCSTLFTPTRSEKSGTPCTSWGEHIHRVRHKKLLRSHLLMADYSLYGRARAGYFILETLLWWSKKKEGRTALEQQQVSECPFQRCINGTVSLYSNNRKLLVHERLFPLLPLVCVSSLQEFHLLRSAQFRLRCATLL